MQRLRPSPRSQLPAGPSRPLGAACWPGQRRTTPNVHTGPSRLHAHGTAQGGAEPRPLLLPRILKETDDFLAVCKPPGMPFHGYGTQAAFLKVQRAGSAPEGSPAAGEGAEDDEEDSEELAASLAAAATSAATGGLAAEAEDAPADLHTRPWASLGLLQTLRRARAEGLLSFSTPPQPGAGSGRLYAAHRLDTPTSGVVVLAKSARAAGLLSAAFRARQVPKLYVALSGRKPARKEGSVVGDMARSRRASYKLLRTTEDPAVTRLWSTGLPELRAGVRLWLMRPETGRTHQLRVALKSLGAPVLGDPRYAAAADAHLEDRCYLHAAAIRVRLPGMEPLQVVCNPAQYSGYGTLFAHPAFSERCEELLPQSLEEELGVWDLSALTPLLSLP